MGNVRLAASIAALAAHATHTCLPRHTTSRATPHPPALLSLPLPVCVRRCARARIPAWHACIHTYVDAQEEEYEAAAAVQQELQALQQQRDTAALWDKVALLPSFVCLASCFSLAAPWLAPLPWLYCLYPPQHMLHGPSSSAKAKRRFIVSGVCRHARLKRYGVTHTRTRVKRQSRGRQACVALPAQVHLG